MSLNELRTKIDDIDNELLKLFEKRLQVAQEICSYKSENNLPILVPEREKELLNSRCANFDDTLKPFVNSFFKQLMSISRNFQTYKTIEKNIVLIGMMGSGKTDKGLLLSEKLNFNYIDIDSEIEKRYNLTINEIFDKYGEKEFRKIESQFIKEISNMKKSVISTGGGIILNEENMQCLKQNGIIIFLNRDINCIAESINTENRPLLKDNPNKIYEIYDNRLPLYKKWCDIELKGENSIEQSVNEIIFKLQTQTV